jgi:hypothetical protein
MADGYFASKDPFDFAQACASSVFTGPGLQIEGNPATGNLWVNLPKATVQRLQGTNSLVVDRSTLTRHQARFIASFFDRQSQAAQIPWILGPASLIPGVGTIITIATSTLDGVQRMSHGSVDADQLSVLMAEGGAFVKTLALDKSSRVTASILYSVKVASEARTYGICSQTFALNAV